MNEKEEIERGLIDHLCLIPSDSKRLTISPEFFTNAALKEIFVKIYELKDTDWDMLLLRSYLPPLLKQRLDQICDGMAGGVLEFYEQRLIEIKTNNLIDDLREEQPDLIDPYLFAKELIERYSKFKKSSDDFMVSDLIGETFKQLEEVYKNKSTLTGLSTGIDQLDLLTSGLQKGFVYIMAGRPSMGKSSLASQIALNVAKSGHHVYLQSMEENTDSLMRRFISNLTNINSEILRTGNFRDCEWDKIVAAIESLGKLSITINPRINLKSHQIAQHITTYSKTKPVDLFIVDHLQEIRDDAQNRHLSISLAASTLRHVAKTLNIPVIILCQLSRAVEQAKNNVPELNHLKESGDIEAIADVVMLLYRPFYYDESTDESDLHVKFAKNRYGRTGCVYLKCDLRTATFK